MNNNFPFYSKTSDQIRVSLLGGIVLTTVLTIIAFRGTSNTWVCTFAWNGCLGVEMFGTPKSAKEGTALDLFGLAVGILFGIPVYSIVSFGILELWAWFTRRHNKSMS